METLRYVLLTNGLLAVVTIAFYVLLRRETFFGANRLALWLGLTASLVLPLLRIPDWRPQPVRAVMQRTAQVIVPRVLPSRPATQPEVTITFPNGKTYPVSPVKPLTGFTWSWQTGLIALYAVGVLLLLIRLGVQVVNLRRMISRSEHEDYGDFTLVRNEHVRSPFSFFGWVVLNPACHAPDELDQILRHERVHVRARHSLDMIGAELVSIVFWFNPAAYLFRYLLHQTLEFAADRAVLAEGVDVRAYQFNLIKVSLSAGQSAPTNHFSRSQLKSRIVMLNKPKSAKTTWLKYPVVCLAALTVVTVFARPNAKTLQKFMPAPVAETVAAVVTTELTVAEPVTLIEAPVWKDTVKRAPAQTPKPEANVTAMITVDTIEHKLEPDSTRTSPSRYILYKGNYLYWVVTPKTTFDDFAVIKQEFAKYGNQMQLNEVKFDSFYVFIDRLVFSVVEQGVGSTKVDDTADDDKPISSAAGYFGVTKNAGSRGTGGVKEYGSELPEPLRKVAAEDEAAVARLIKDRRIEYKLQAGYSKFAQLGSSSATYKKDDSGKNIHKSSDLIVQPDGSLSVDKALGDVKIFINNEPVVKEAVRMWSINQLHAVVQKRQSKSAKDEAFTTALLIYVNEDN